MKRELCRSPWEERPWFIPGHETAEKMLFVSLREFGLVVRCLLLMFPFPACPTLTSQAGLQALPAQENGNCSPRLGSDAATSAAELQQISEPFISTRGCRVEPPLN